MPLCAWVEAGARATRSLASIVEDRWGLKDTNANIRVGSAEVVYIDEYGYHDAEGEDELHEVRVVYEEGVAGGHGVWVFGCL